MTRWTALLGMVVLPLASTWSQDDTVVTEKQLLSDYKSAYKSSVEQKVAAIDVLSEMSRSLEDGGTSKAVAKALAKDFDEDELSICGAVASALAYGREVGTVLDWTEDVLKELRGGIEKRNGIPGEEPAAWRRDAAQIFGRICESLGRHEDDRSVEILSFHIRSLSRNNKKGSGNVSSLLIEPLAESLLSLGSQEAVEIVVMQTGTYIAGGKNKIPRQRLHDALAAFSEATLNQGAPAFSSTYDQSWRAWFKEYEKSFPKKLGKLSDPPEAPAYDPLAKKKREREANQGGRAP